MKTFKKIILILSIFCVTLPIQAMDSNGSAGFLSKVLSFAKEHPLLTTLAIAIPAAGLIYSHGKSVIDWHMNARATDLAVTKKLIAQKGYIDSRDTNGKTPLHWAAIDGHTSKIGLLISHGANVEARDDNGCTPLYYAAQRSRDAVLSILHHAHFSPKKEFSKDSQDRIIATCIVSKRLCLPQIVRNSILAHLAEDTLSQDHCRLLYNTDFNLPELVATCPLEWFINIYNKTYDTEKAGFLKKIVPAIINYRLEKLQALLKDPKLKELLAHLDPAIATLLDPDDVEQYRHVITSLVPEKFIGQ